MADTIIRLLGNKDPTFFSLVALAVLKANYKNKYYTQVYSEAINEARVSLTLENGVIVKVSGSRAIPVVLKELSDAMIRQTK
jgi:6,7-dimethyl-8-ribityllumazine synthase